METFGKPTITPFIYYTGKLSAYLTWVAFFLQIAGIDIRIVVLPPWLMNSTLLIALIGTIFAIAAMKDLGSSLRFGLPTISTEFKSKGLYAISRNPIYLGIFALTGAAMTYTFNPIVIILGIYGILTHHLITLSEEKFLKGRFGQPYIEYCRKVRRYL